MYIINSTTSPFSFLLKKKHDPLSILEKVKNALLLSSDMIELASVDSIFSEELNEHALVYIYIYYNTDGFLTIVDLGLLRHTSLHREASEFLLSLNKQFKDDVATILNDDTFLLARNSVLFNAVFAFETDGHSELYVLEESSLKKL